MLTQAEFLKYLLMGAAFVSTEVGKKMVGDAYGALKEQLIKRFGFASAPILEKRPSDESVQKVVSEELVEAKAHEDVQIDSLAVKLKEAIERMPSDALVGSGINISQLNARLDIVIGNLRGSSVRVQGLTSTDGGIRIGDVNT